ncbi:MAG: YbjN domain-containing protein [Proteobacteria bacterium]|nr:YbjN domain-containing protein [Pseudomonadota bacterium]
MALMHAELQDTPNNPIDLMEELVRENQWMCDRASDEELLVELTGRWCDYRMFFVWREQVKALYFTCSLDMKVVPEKRRAINDLLSLVNERMWFGHFELCSEAGTPMFRHTMLTRGWDGASAEQLEDLVDIAVCECERFYPAFQYVLWAGYTAAQAVEATMLDTVGEA